MKTLTNSFCLNLADISPEDIFEMFFGGGFSSRSVHRRRTHFRFQRAEENPQETVS